MSEKISAVVLAAGRGTRLQNSTPKAYLSLGGKALLSYSLERFARCDQVSEIIVVIHPDDAELFGRTVRVSAKPTRIVHGGAQRGDSALAGVRAATGHFVLVHDAARPFVSLELIERVIAAMKTHDAAVPVLSIADSLKRVSEGFIAADVDRSEIFQVQTPQGFRRELLLSALESACEQKRYFTDEAGAVLAMAGVQAKSMPGDELNIKITAAADLRLADCLLQQRI